MSESAREKIREIIDTAMKSGLTITEIREAIEEAMRGKNGRV